MKEFISIALIIFLSSSDSKSQNVQIKDTGKWEVYIAGYEKGPGSTVLNMGLVNKAPDKKLPFIVITGVTFTNCREDGLPEENEFINLHEISDDVQKSIAELTNMEMAGTFTYQCERLDYVYVSDTSKIRKSIAELYKSKYSKYKSYISIKRDENWDAYLKFLYPNEETQEDMSNQKVLTQLQKNGDKLTKARLVDHWIYFASSQDRENFEKNIFNDGFKIEGREKVDDTDKPFQLHISRVDKVDPESINKITLDLRHKARQVNGNYDGWETFIVK